MARSTSPVKLKKKLAGKTPEEEGGRKGTRYLPHRLKPYGGAKVRKPEWGVAKVWRVRGVFLLRGLDLQKTPKEGMAKNSRRGCHIRVSNRREGVTCWRSRYSTSKWKERLS